MNGETVQYDLPFSNGMDWPGDWRNGSAAEVAFCKCVLDVEVREDRRAREVERYSQDWTSHSLSDTVDALIPGAVAKQNRARTKTLYDNPDATDLMVVADHEHGYFRVQQKGIRNKDKPYRGIDGKPVRYNDDDDYDRKTHFRMEGDD